MWNLTLGFCFEKAWPKATLIQSVIFLFLIQGTDHSLCSGNRKGCQWEALRVGVRGRAWPGRIGCNRAGMREILRNFYPLNRS